MCVRVLVGVTYDMYVLVCVCACVRVLVGVTDDMYVCVCVCWLV